MPPRIVLLFSGKRKTGKDYLTDHLKKLLAEKCEVIRISQPIKSHWAREKNLNLNELLGEGEYKEHFRLEMIKWSDEMRDQDYGCFCREACQNAADRSIWIVSDIRRKTDILWFKESYGDLIRTIRIIADDETRKRRGFNYVADVDSTISECDLDNYESWDLVIDNGKDGQQLDKQLGSILGMWVPRGVDVVIKPFLQFLGIAPRFTLVFQWWSQRHYNDFHTFWHGIRHSIAAVTLKKNAGGQATATKDSEGKL